MVQASLFIPFLLTYTETSRTAHEVDTKDQVDAAIHAGGSKRFRSEPNGIRMKPDGMSTGSRAERVLQSWALRDLETR